jgi:hypothetical protein
MGSRILFPDYRKILKFKNLIQLIILIILILKPIFNIPGIGIDNSWKIALNMALKENLVFGKDFIFTYGPLGYLSTGIPVYTSNIPIVLFYIFIVANGIFFIHFLFKLLNKKFEIIFVSVVLIFFGYFLFWRNSIPLYFYFLFHLFHFIRNKNFLSLITASVICLLTFYMKVNTGIIMNVLFLMFIVYSFLSKDLKPRIGLLVLLSHFSILFLLSYFLNTDFYSYIRNSIPIINAYNDAMVRLKYELQVYIALAILFLLIVISSLSIRKIATSLYEIFLFLNISLITFILFKQAFVRADLHVNLFFSGINFIVLLVIAFSEIKMVKSSFYYGFIIISMLSLFAFVGPIKSLGLESWSAFMNRDKIESWNRSQRKLPKNIINEIKDGTVDVLGNEVSYIYFNDLRYDPRPIIQSYNAYDKPLIDINHKKYDSESSPDFILYHYGSIDDRHGFWDEPKTYMALFKNYTIFDTVPAKNKHGHPLIVFKKRESCREIVENVIMDTIIPLHGKFIIPHSENILFLELHYNYSLPGKLRRILFQPSLVYMNIHYEKSKSFKVRLIKTVMSSGVPINKKVEHYYDAIQFFNSFGKMNENAVSFDLEGDPKWFRKDLRLRLVEYEILE